MLFGNPIPDKTLLKQVVQRLARSGAGSQSHVTPTVRSGEVTLTGTLRYEHERRAILTSTNSISGIRRVIDQMRVAPKRTSWT
jgi:osmotically-inducible protein OsmY